MRPTLLLASAAVAALAVPTLLGAQAPPALPTFEVAAVKPTAPNDRVMGLRQLDAGGRVVFRGYTLRQLIQVAYVLLASVRRRRPAAPSSGGPNLLAILKRGRGHQSGAAAAAGWPGRRGRCRL